MEYSCCERCNDEGRHSDLVAATFSKIRHTTTAAVSWFDKDFSSHLRGLKNNCPEVIAEMRELPRAKSKFTLRDAGLPADGGVIQIGGTVTHSYMELFAARLGFVTHFDQTGHRVRDTGGVMGRWYTNADLINGDYPREVLSQFSDPKTLRQGSRHAFDQFAMVWLTDGVGISSVFAVFHGNLAIMAIAADDARVITDVDPDFERRIVRPGQLGDRITRKLPPINWSIQTTA